MLIPYLHASFYGLHNMPKEVSYTPSLLQKSCLADIVRSAEYLEMMVFCYHLP